MIRTVFLGTAPYGFPTLRMLRDHPEVDLRGVLTQPDRQRGRGQEPQSPPVANHARDLSLEVLQPEDINQDGLKMIRRLGPLDLMVVIAYGQILDEAVFSYPEYGTYNVHASLLPRWRGAAPIRHTLLEGDERTGVTVFRIDDGLDTGPVNEQIATKVRPGETYGELYDRLSELNVGAVRVLLQDVGDPPVPHFEQSGEPTHAAKVDSGDGRVDWSRPAREIERRVRAFCPRPGAHTQWEDQRLKLYRVRVEPDGSAEHPPGTILETGDSGIRVQTGKEVLVLEELQLAGSSRMEADAFLAGRPELQPGSRLG